MPDNVGGRYSVLTAVGLLPIACCGIYIEALMHGAQAEREDTLKRGVLSGPANERIANSCIKELTFLNTIPPLEGACSKIKYLDVSPIFADAIQRIYEENSMSVLF